MFTQLKYLAVTIACAMLATTASAQSVTDVRGPSPAVPVENENLRVLSVFGKAAAGVSPRIGHVHVTVDDAPWHFVDTSGETIVVVGLPAGPHSVQVELADAAHRALASETVRFTLPVVSAAKAHDD